MLSDHDYKLYTVPQENAEGKKKYWPRGEYLASLYKNSGLMRLRQDARRIFINECHDVCVPFIILIPNTII
jgi:hypothetical protein